MNRIPVTSTNIASIGWENDVLEVEFTSGGVYQYQGVPKDVYDGFMAAASKGKYLASSIKGAYPFTKV